MDTEDTIRWNKLPGSTTKTELLLGWPIAPSWLERLQADERLASITFSGDLLSALRDLADAARQQKLNLPMGWLRASLMFAIDDLVSVDTHLGLKTHGQGVPAAAEIYDPTDEDRPRIRDELGELLSHWIRNHVDPWAARHDLASDGLTERVLDAVRPEHIAISSLAAPGQGSPNFRLIAHTIGKRLAGETLFEGLDDPCELVVARERGNAIELMTHPVQGGRNQLFSMVARLSVVTVPYSNQLFLAVRAVKRVWAASVPKAYSGAPRTATGYVIRYGFPAIPVTVRRGKESWEFDDDYAELRERSGGILPETLAQAIEQRRPDPDTDWWVGLPELTTLFRYISPQTVYEGDEHALFTTVVDYLQDILDPKPISAQFISLKRRGGTKTDQQMLRLADCGMAFEAFDGNDDESEDEAEGETASRAKRRQKIEEYRQQNLRALHRAYPQPPIVWMLGGSDREQESVRSIIRVLFGDELQVECEPLPLGTHGLRKQLDAEGAKATERFEKRVECWQSATAEIRKVSGDRPIIALICAPDRIGGIPEDTVNYYAGIHAMAAIEANTHYILPIENPDDQSSQQDFLYRAQSAILDVVLAHSGMLFGVEAFVRKTLTDPLAPRYVVGIQAVRSRAAAFSGQTGVSFLLFSRLVVATGTTDIRVGYRRGKATEISEWMPLAAGLRWIGQQRRLQDGDENWLKLSFEDTTKRVLLEIAREDAKAVVLIDWSTVAGLWKSLTDASLTANDPQIGNTRLAAFRGLSFVRLRRGASTMLLRQEVKNIYEGRRLAGTRGEQPMGETYVDTYVTTTKTLARVASNDTGAHFIGSMIYRNTVNTIRGRSCYRSTSRINKDDTLISLPPEHAGTAALPAPLDITVMHAPADVDPQRLAILVMGLRQGYAHYNDWTALPAPLFFLRKIRDYIIGYPGEEEGETEGEESELTPYSSVQVNDFSLAIAEAASGVSTADDDSASQLQSQLVQAAETTATPALTRDIVAVEPEKLLTTAQDVDMPNISTVVSRRKLYQGMLKSEFPVRVELPGWIDLMGLFGPTPRHIKNRISRCLNTATNLGYLDRRTKKPKHTPFLDWLAQKFMPIPQACVAVATFTAVLDGGVYFVHLNDIICNEYNPEQNEDAQVNPTRFDREALQRITDWAEARAHDEALGWLIILIAQFPKQDWIEAVLGSMTRIIGPRTEFALRYYLACAYAVNLAIDQYKKNEDFKFAPIHVSLPPSRPVESPAEPSGSDHVNHHRKDSEVLPEPPSTPPSAGGVARVAGTIEDATRQDDQHGDAIMTIKKSLSELIEKITPGSDGFDSTREQIQSHIDQLTHLHEQIRAEQLALATRAERAAVLDARQNELLATVTPLLADLDVTTVASLDLSAERFDGAEQELDIIAALAQECIQRATEVRNAKEAIATASLLEQTSAIQRLQESSTAQISAMQRLKDRVEQGICFALTVVAAKSEDDSELVAAETAATPTLEDTPSATPVIPEQPSNALEVQRKSVTSAPATPISNQGPSGDISNDTPSPQKANETPAAQDAPAELASTQLDQPETTDREPIETEDAEDTEYEDTATSSEMTSTEAALTDERISVLTRCLNKRLYGLATVQLEALRKAASLAQDEDTENHLVILRALVTSLHRMDCSSSFDYAPDGGLQNLIDHDEFPTSPSCDQTYTAMGVFGAVVGSLLFNNSTSLWNAIPSVTKRLSDYPKLQHLTEHLDEIRKKHHSLSREWFLMAHIDEERAKERESKRIAAKAENWIGEPEVYSSFISNRYRRAFHLMFGPNGTMGQCLAAIRRGDIDRADGILKKNRKDFDDPKGWLRRMFKQMNDRTKPDGPYEEKSIQNIETTRDFLEQAIAFHRRRRNPRRELATNIQQFLDQLERKLGDSLSDLELIDPGTELEKLYHTGIRQALRLTRQLYTEEDQPKCLSNLKQMVLIQLPLSSSLLPALDPIDDRTPELCNPNEVFSETARFVDEPAPDLYIDIDQELATAIAEHCSGKRFLPAFTASNILRDRSREVQSNYTEEARNFRDELRVTRQKVTHALTLSAVDQSTATSMLHMIEELLRLIPDQEVNKHRMPFDGTGTYADFAQARAALRAHVSQPLEAKLTDAANRIREELERIQESIDNPIDCRRIAEMLDGENAADIRAAHDALNILRTGERLPKQLGTMIDLAGTYDAFIKQIKGIGGNQPILENLVARLSEPPRDDDPECIAELAESQRENAVRILEHWIDFFDKRRVRDLEEPLERLFRWLGVTKTPHGMAETGASGSIIRLQFPKNVFHYPTRSNDQFFVPPRLGSDDAGVQGYVLYGNTNENDLMQLPSEATPTLIITRTKLDMAKRARICKGTNRLLIDDYLVAYVAIRQSEGFRDWFEIAMLTFVENPYDDYNTRPVPSEMFFGRERELRRLRDVKGIGVLYGGRRLGKSSLLCELEREINASSGRKAVYFSMPADVVTDDYMLATWRQIHRQLLHRDIIAQATTTPTDWKSYRDIIIEALSAERETTTLDLLIDETDVIMKRELSLNKGEIGFVSSLAGLIEGVSQQVQVRIILAGLHNMSKMVNDENSVFGKTEPIALEPFNSPEDIPLGISLITKPLSAMGYLFRREDSDLPLRILSVCNFYPAFIQLYCKRLLQRLQNKRADTAPPTFVEAKDLDEVENDHDLLESLRDKFELNLNLDKRYKAIALSLADAYYTHVDQGHVIGLSMTEIREYCEIYAQTHFPNTSPGVYEALLDEMQKLNIVERERARYRLRNPNIAMMIGNKDEVMEKLNELANEPAETQIDYGERRVTMVDSNGESRLFPMPSIWVRRYLNPDDSQLIILCGNALSGISSLEIRRRDEWQLSDGRYQVMQGTGPNRFERDMDRSRGQIRQDKLNRIWAVPHEGWQVDQVFEFLRLAEKAKRMNIRIVLLATAERAWDISQAIDTRSVPALCEVPSARRRSIYIAEVPPWSEDAIRFFFHEKPNIANNVAAIETVKQASGGFTDEVIKLHGTCRTPNQLDAELKRKRASHSAGYQGLYTDFGLPQTFTEVHGENTHDFLRTVNGMKRDSDEFAEAIQSWQVSEGRKLYLQWMGLLQHGSDGTWAIPAFYPDA